MPLNLEKISAFIEDEDENTFGFSVEEELNDHSVKISILGEFNFILSIDENEHYVSELSWKS